MRPLSFVLAFAFFIAGPLIQHVPDGTLPGAGTFNYTGTPLAANAPQVIASATVR